MCLTSRPPSERKYQPCSSDRPVSASTLVSSAELFIEESLLCPCSSSVVLHFAVRVFLKNNDIAPLNICLLQNVAETEVIMESLEGDLVSWDEVEVDSDEVHHLLCRVGFCTCAGCQKEYCMYCISDLQEPPLAPHRALIKAGSVMRHAHCFPLLASCVANVTTR